MVSSLVSREGGEVAKVAKGSELELEELATIAIDCGLKVHRRLGPGLLENVYEKILANLLQSKGLKVETQVNIPIKIDDFVFEYGFRADLVIEGRLLVELKAVERLNEVHHKQVLTYLRAMDFPLGILMNFSGARFSDGLKRVANNHRQTAGSKLRMHQ